MSKKTHRMAELKEQEKASRPERVSVAPKKTGPKKAKNGWVTGGAQPRSNSRPNVTGPVMSAGYLRVVGILMALVGLGGGFYFALQIRQDFTPAAIVGLIALGLLGGLGAFTAVRAKDLAARARKK